MIPKIIHYCWYGDSDLSDLTKSCIASWRVHLSDYDILKWDETNSPMDHHFVQEAYSGEKYAFVSDYVRLWALYHHGGIYLDTDMLVLKGLDGFLNEKCFLGYQSQDSINASIIGCEPKDQFIRACLDAYDNTIFGVNNLSDIAIPEIITRIFKSGSFERDAVRLYQPEYFYSFPFEASIHLDKPYTHYLTANSYAVHLWDASWIDGMQAFREGQNRGINKRTGVKNNIKSWVRRFL